VTIVSKSAVDSLRRSRKLHTYPPKVKRMVAKPYSCLNDLGCGFLCVGSV